MPSKTGRRGENYFATREEGKTFRNCAVLTLATRSSDSSDPNVVRRPIPQDARLYSREWRGRKKKEDNRGAAGDERKSSSLRAETRSHRSSVPHPMTIRCQLRIPLIFVRSLRFGREREKQYRELQESLPSNEERRIIFETEYLRQLSAG